MEFLDHLAELTKTSSTINDKLYSKFHVKRGLRNADTTGVLVGLSTVGGATGYLKRGDKVEPIDGRLTYRGIDIYDLVRGFQSDGRHGFDETVYLLMFGRLPEKETLDQFSKFLADERELPQYFTKNMILSLRGKDVMNMLARAVLALYVYDDNPDTTTNKNIVRQSLSLIAKFPAIITYAFHGMRYHYMDKSLIIRHPQKNLSTAENFLYMLKGNNRYTPLEADLLDLALVLHAEHGGGNNSTFATHVVSSSGTDTYSAIAAALGSLKGPLHGGANIRVMKMMENIKENVKNWTDESEVRNYLLKILRKEAYDRSGKIYGFGHAVYTVSDPRAVLLKEKARELAREKGRIDEFQLYELVERLAPDVFKEFKGNKIISPNVDYYSGFVYCSIDIPGPLYTPLFAMARIVGWCAHRLEELNSSKRIIRPAYRNVSCKHNYVPLGER
jgi:citrate synthase